MAWSCASQDTQRRMPRIPCCVERGQGMTTRMRATACAGQLPEARAVVETRKDQVQHVRGVHAGTRTAGSSRGSFCASLERASQRGSKATPPRMLCETDLIRAAMIQKDGDPHKIDYSRVGSRPFLFCHSVLTGHPENTVFHASTVFRRQHLTQLVEHANVIEISGERMSATFF